MNYLPHQVLPIGLIDQQLVSSVLTGFFAERLDSYSQNTQWVGINSGDGVLDKGYALQIRPFLANLKGRDETFYDFKQQWDVDLYGVAVRLLKDLPGGNVAASIVTGNSHSETHRLPEKVKDHSDYLGGFISGEIDRKWFDVTGLAGYQRGHHHLNEYLSQGRLRTDIDTSLTVVQAGIHRDFPVGDWRIVPLVNVSRWKMEQDDYSFAVDNSSVKVSGGAQRVWQFSPRVEVVSPRMPTTSPSLSWQSSLMLGYTTVLGDGKMNTHIKAVGGQSENIPLSALDMDKHSWQANLGLKLFGDQFSGAISYNYASSKHITTQELTASVGWLF